MSRRANNHGPEPRTCAERAGASWSLTTTSSKSGQYGNVVRRGVIPSVTGVRRGHGVVRPRLRKNRPERAQTAAVGRIAQSARTMTTVGMPGFCVGMPGFCRGPELALGL